jgi:hypothetical protein
VGLLQVVGSVTGSRALLAAGAWTGAAPLPRVFSRQQGIETYARRAAIEVELADGRVERIDVDHAFGRRIDGPVVRGAAYAHAALYAGLDGSARRGALLERAFCAPGDVARELGIEGPVLTVTVRNWSALGSQERMGGAEITCPP